MRKLVWMLGVLMILGAACKNSKMVTDPSKELEVSEEVKAKLVSPDKQQVKTKTVEEEAAPSEPIEEKTQAEDIEKYRPEVPDNLFFRMERTPCFGQCPVFNVDVSDNGHAILEGRQNFDYLGFYQSQMTEDQINRIIELAVQHGYFDMDHVYDAPVTDLPSTTTVVNSQVHGMHWVYNRMHAPDELRAFEMEVETIIKDLQWFPYKPEKD